MSSIQGVRGRMQCFRDFGRQRPQVASPRLQLQPSRFPNPTINTLRLRGYSSNVPSIESCPCGSDLTVPDLEGDEIDMKSPLTGVITRHYRHVLIHTGTIDWPSRIEDGPSISSKRSRMSKDITEDEESSSITAKLKALVSRGSIYVDPFYPILVTNTSLPIDSSAQEGHGTITVFPDAVEVTSIPNSMESLRSLVTSFLLPPSNPLSSRRKDRESFTTKRISKPVILTCSHGNRDKRCGVLGPAIARAFKEALANGSEKEGIDYIIGDISHIGGHKFAGNVIIHLPGDHPLSEAINNAPASTLPAAGPEDVREKAASSRSVSIWYGRVMPYHVEGIIKTTLKEGKIVKELLRGIVNSDGDLVDLHGIGFK
ncbi:hypothetical protein TWF102_001916 [Orbilia oligospora]|uniref:Altered inheritance of mitochondria protein 32 n=1 Tax=Orbilia oligospora TaxID=2813651 RepID=A0A7C8NJR6_ORBOL|nr:hypothetical protein TWF103_007739 [Orbilia oligospora]KAF3106019.1 hypothetical protein TWF102_001916 [Orbilia oligospora]KAF3107311.1 hypothetical protein TWF706_003005 [Orbilia oligospora]KAF3134262.1 hypothetical protein TWF594_008813 [Orbilia oligospora]